MSSDRLAYALLAMLLVISAYLVSVFYSGPFVYFDDNYYMLFANQLLNNTYKPTGNLYSVEPLTIASTALSFKIFGVSLFTATFPEVASYLLLILITFLAGRALRSAFFGILSGFFVATAPFVLGYTTRVLPDILAGLLVAFACYLFIMTRQQKRNATLMFASGFIAALTISAKTQAMLFVLLFITSAFITQTEFGRDPKLRKQLAIKNLTKLGLLALLLGVGAGVLLNLSFFLVTTGNPLFSIMTYSRDLVAQSPSTLSQNIHSLNIIVDPLYAISASPQMIDAFVYPLGLIVVFALLGSLIGVAKRNPQAAFLSVIVWIQFFYFFFGTQSLAAYTFIAANSRFFAIIAMPLSILASYFAFYVFDTLKARPEPVAVLFILAVLLVSVALLLPTYTGLRTYNSGIAAYTNAYTEALSYTRSLAPNQNMCVGGYLGGLDTQFFSAIGGYNASLKIGQLGVGECAASNCNGTLLLETFNNYAQKAEINQTNSLLKGACRRIPLKNFTQVLPPNGYVEVSLSRLQKAANATSPS